MFLIVLQIYKISFSAEYFPSIPYLMIDFSFKCSKPFFIKWNSFQGPSVFDLLIYTQKNQLKIAH